MDIADRSFRGMKMNGAGSFHVLGASILRLPKLGVRSCTDWGTVIGGCQHFSPVTTKSIE